MDRAPPAALTCPRVLREIFVLFVLKHPVTRNAQRALKKVLFLRIAGRQDVGGL